MSGWLRRRSRTAAGTNEDGVDARAKERARTGCPQWALGALYEDLAHLALQRRKLLRDGGLGVTEDVRRRRDRAEIRDERERAQAPRVEGHEATLLLLEAYEVELMSALMHHRA